MGEMASDTTIRHWNAPNWSGDGLHWLEIPAVKARLNVKASGEPEVDWVRHTVGAHLAGRLPLDRCLSLGCGEGWLERRLADLGVFRACDAYDLASGILDEARQRAAQQGYHHIHYHAADVNTLDLPADTYDVVWINGAMHHFEQLDRIGTRVAHCLKPGGLLVLNEYVGPSRFQFGDRQKQLISCAFALLPARYRLPVPVRSAAISSAAVPRRDWLWYVRRMRDKLLDGDLLPALRRRWTRYRLARSTNRMPVSGVTFPTARDIIAADPSEAVHSADILDVVARYFTIVERRDLGGALIHFLFEGVAGNFIDGDPETAHWLELLFSLEDALMADGELGSDFVYLVAERAAEQKGREGEGEKGSSGA